MFCLGCCLAFPWSFEKFQASVAHERLAYKKCVDSNLNADQSNFLAKKLAWDVLELYVKNNIVHNNSRPKPNYKIVYWTLPLSEKVYTEHCISKLLSIMHRLQIE